jgi:hypothetical protein
MNDFTGRVRLDERKPPKGKHCCAFSVCCEGGTRLCAVVVVTWDEEGGLMNDFTGRVRLDERKPPKGKHCCAVSVFGKDRNAAACCCDRHPDEEGASCTTVVAQCG